MVYYATLHLTAGPEGSQFGTFDAMASIASPAAILVSQLLLFK